MSKYYITADTHFNHVDKMIEFCNRPKNYEARLFKNMSELDETTTLIHLGDVTFGDILEAHEKYIKPLKCRKILIKGNHDHESNSRYYKMGWDFVCHSFSDTFFGQKILFTHCPSPIRDFDYNIFGHFHTNIKTLDDLTPENRAIITDKHLLYALEYNNYIAKPLNHIINKADKFRLLNMLEPVFELKQQDINMYVDFYECAQEYVVTLKHMPTEVIIQKVYKSDNCYLRQHDKEILKLMLEDKVKEHLNI